MGFLFAVVNALVLEVVLLHVVFMAPQAAWDAVGPTPRELADAQLLLGHLAEAKTLVYGGAAIFAASAAYAGLPFTPVPRLPFLGKVDKALATSAALFGLALAYLGHELGTGLVPAEAKAVVRCLAPVVDAAKKAWTYAEPHARPLLQQLDAQLRVVRKQLAVYVAEQLLAA